MSLEPEKLRELAEAALGLANHCEGVATVVVRDKQDAVMAEVEANAGETVDVVLNRYVLSLFEKKPQRFNADGPPMNWRAAARIARGCGNAFFEIKEGVSYCTDCRIAENLHRGRS